MIQATPSTEKADAGQNSAKSDLFRTTFHRDGTVTYWNVYQQRWQRQRASSISDSDLSTMSAKDRARTLRMAA